MKEKFKEKKGKLDEYAAIGIKYYLDKWCIFQTGLLVRWALEIKYGIPSTIETVKWYLLPTWIYLIYLFFKFRIYRFFLPRSMRKK